MKLLLLFAILVVSSSSTFAAEKIRVSGGAANANVRPRSTTLSGNGTDARSRAANDRVVRRVQEKFGAEIRTVIDQSNKR